MAAVRVLGMLSQPDAFAASGLLVGRMVANSTFLRSLMVYGDLEEIRFFLGEKSEYDIVDRVQEWAPEGLKVHAANLLDLPEAMEQGTLDAIHFTDLNDRMATVIHLRNRFAKKVLPVTGQIHSLSYPSTMQTYQHLLFGNPAPYDAVFCSTVAGRDVVMNCISDLTDRLRRRGLPHEPMQWSMPVVPLGVDVNGLRSGNREEMRRRLEIPENAYVFLSIGRFTEYDKMDLFPVVQAFAAFRKKLSPNEPAYLVLAGASQGTETAKMVAIWAKALQVDQWVKLRVDFEDGEKAGLLAAADAFVSMTDNPQETYGLSVVEAMGAGLPVLVSDFNGYKDTVQEGVGIRVKTRWNTEMDYLSDLAPLLYERPLHLFLGQAIEVDLAELIAGFETLFYDREAGKAMGQAGAARARALYDWSEVIPQYLSHWNRLAALPRRKRAETLNVLRMSYRGAFAHYPTEWADMGRLVVRSEWSRMVVQDSNRHPIFTELRLLFDGEDVVKSLNIAEEPITRGALQAKMTKGPEESAYWRAGALIAWLLKHGLLVDAELP